MICQHPRRKCRRLATAILFLVFSLSISAQQTPEPTSFNFAHLSDTHVGSPTGLDDLRRTVADINAQSGIRFVIISGDITEFGSDEELKLAKQVLDSLNKPWYIIPGNHDDNWSESGTNSFRQVFGKETFEFFYGGYCFLGTNCGPNLRMGPGQVPHEHLVWLEDALRRLPDPATPVIFVNHYPIDPALNNWYQVIDLLKKYNTQAILCGHGHANRQYSFEGIPGVMGRSNLRANDSVGGYNIVTVRDGMLRYYGRRSGRTSDTAWAAVSLQKHAYSLDTTHYSRPSYAVNDRYPAVKVQWSIQDSADIGCGIALYRDLLVTADAAGNIFALQQRTGRRAWQFATEGKIFSTPAVAEDRVVVASSDGSVYCLQASTGRLLWKHPTGRPVVASPLLREGIVYFGASDGHFRAVKLMDGTLLWDFPAVTGFVESRPLFYGGRIYFASWGNELYALDAATGRLDWKWSSGAANRMFSAAACVPVAAKGRLFIVAPDRYMTSFDAASGTVLWRKFWDSAWVRQSMGLSTDSSLVYVKTMQGKLVGISTEADSPVIAFNAALDLGYELDPAAIIESGGIIYVPSDKGLATAVDRSSGKMRWQHKMAHSLLNTVLPGPRGLVFISSMDGRICCLRPQ